MNRPPAFVECELTFSPELPTIEGFPSLRIEMTVGTRTSNRRARSRSFWCISIVSLSSVASAFLALKSAHRDAVSFDSLARETISERARVIYLSLSTGVCRRSTESPDLRGQSHGRRCRARSPRWKRTRRKRDQVRSRSSSRTTLQKVDLPWDRGRSRASLTRSPERCEVMRSRVLVRWAGVRIVSGRNFRPETCFASPRAAHSSARPRRPPRHGQQACSGCALHNAPTRKSPEGAANLPCERRSLLHQPRSLWRSLNADHWRHTIPKSICCSGPRRSRTIWTSPRSLLTRPP